MSESCYWCGSSFARDRKTREHLHPLEYGGNSTALQLALVKSGLARATERACMTCNTHRAHERDGAWVPFPYWLSMKYADLPKSQRRAMKKRGKIAA